MHFIHEYVECGEELYESQNEREELFSTHVFSRRKKERIFFQSRAKFKVFVADAIFFNTARPSLNDA